MRKIPGVGAVKNLLHLPARQHQTKAAALRAGARVLEHGGWSQEPPPDVNSEK